MSRSRRWAPRSRFAAGIFSEVQMAMNRRCSLIRTSGSTFSPHSTRCAASSLAANASASACLPSSDRADSDSVIHTTVPNAPEGANTEGTRRRRRQGPSAPTAEVKARTAASLRPETLDQTGAGASAFLPDESYSEAGASIVPADQLGSADAILMVGRPDADQIVRLRPGQAIVGMFAPLTDPALASKLAETGATAISLDLIPRTLPRAQPMDALTSQANIAGYKAALLAA